MLKLLELILDLYVLLILNYVQSNMLITIFIQFNCVKILFCQELILKKYLLMFDHAINFAGTGRGVCTILIIIHLISQIKHFNKE